MPPSFEARGGDGIDAGLLKRRSLIGCCGCAYRDDAIRPALIQNLFGGIPKMKLNTGTFASNNTRA